MNSRRSSEVLPEPDGPVRKWKEPGRKWNVTSRSTSLPRPYFSADAVQSDHALSAASGPSGLPDPLMRKLGERINRSGLWRTDGADCGQVANAMLARAGLLMDALNARTREKAAAWPMPQSTVRDHRGRLFGRRPSPSASTRWHGSIARPGSSDLLVVADPQGQLRVCRRSAPGAASRRPVAARSISCRFRAIARRRRSSGRVEIVRDIEIDVAGRNVLIVDDILESGRTLAFAKDLIAARGRRGC